MCCFSRPVTHVADTRIFARFMRPGVQGLAYQMKYQAETPVAMILPLPVARRSSSSWNGKTKPVQFVNLENYPRFFRDLEHGFPPPPTSTSARKSSVPMAGSLSTLVVETVGSFVASYVPTVRDFARLDPQFRLPKQTWDKIPQYRDYGFAVFQLRPSERNQPRSVHPMAFTFVSRFSDRLFLPTVHIHDGKIHAQETFDHQLYMQSPGIQATDETNSWGIQSPVVPNQRVRASYAVAQKFVAVAKTHGLVDGNRHLYKRELRGLLPNQDTYMMV